MIEHELTDNTLQQFANALLNTYGIMISVYDGATERFITQPCGNVDIEQLYLYSTLPNELKTNANRQKPFQIANDLNCLWIAIPEKKNENQLVYVLGPVFISPVTKNQIIQFYYQSGLPITQATILADYYEHIPKMPYQVFVNHFCMLYQIMFGVGPDKSDLVLQNEHKQIFEAKLNDEVIYRMQQRDFEEEREAEKILYERVKNGNTEAMSKGTYSSYIDLTNLGPDDLRSFKNMMIIAIALITRAAVDGGLPVEIAFPLSDYYIVQIESSSNTLAVIDVHHLAADDFTRRVRNNKFKLKYSSLINRCCGYIVANAHRRVTVNEMAEHEGIHPDTLSKRFKKETGKTPIEYARYVKMTEACILLEHSSKPVSEIAIMLGYSSQSQFIYAFKDFAGVTPSEHRKKTSS